MNFTIIAYRPNHDNYSMGHCVGSSSSDFRFEEEFNPEEVGKTQGYFKFLNHTKDSDEADYEVTTLLYGHNIDNLPQEYQDEYPNLLSIIKSYASLEFDRLLQEKVDQENTLLKLRKLQEDKDLLRHAKDIKKEYEKYKGLGLI